jgi:hypothetical protein
MSKLSCHIIGLNPYNKKEFISSLNNKIFNAIDLDIINQEIIMDSEMDKYYRQYVKLKADKNDKFKEVDKKMTNYWEQTFIKKVEESINMKKTNILVGQNSHYKNLSKKIPIDCTNKFIVKSDPDHEVKELIRWNLENHKEEIIGGSFPLQYIDYDALKKKRNVIEEGYKKNGYIEKTIDQISTMINLIEKSNNMNNEIWVSMKEPYNIGSMIYPKINSKLTGYSDANIALLGSINFDGDEVKRMLDRQTADVMEITLKEVKPKGLQKLKTKRYLYLVESKTFMPDENGMNHKFFSQLPVKILAKEKIEDLYDYFVGEKK